MSAYAGERVWIAYDFTQTPFYRRSALQVGRPGCRNNLRNLPEGCRLPHRRGPIDW